MVKVLTRGGQDLGAVRRHLEYLDRKGELDIETDDGQRLSGKGVERDLLENWDLDVEEDRRKTTIDPRPDRRLPKLVHKVLFSMPPGTPRKKVLEAVKNFAREEFGLKHRYAVVLHTDEPHPHVHMVIKTLSERGERLNIRKATLRGWRREFARQLRALGVPANATERAVRGESRSPKLDGAYRAEERGESWRAWARVQEVGRQILSGRIRTEPGKETLIETRKAIERGWWEASEILAAQGQRELAKEVIRFVGRMPPPKTNREVIAEELRKRHRDARAREGPVR
ncbi:MAG: relaxase/mobilization nuclease domain-containing protein [Steroidobacteraceae bacterium]